MTIIDSKHSIETCRLISSIPSNKLPTCGVERDDVGYVFDCYENECICPSDKECKGDRESKYD